MTTHTDLLAPNRQSADDLIASIVGAVLVIVLMFMLVGSAGSAAPMARLDSTAMVPCPAEDAGLSCYWDEQERGNGIGASWYVDAHGGVTLFD